MTDQRHNATSTAQALGRVEGTLSAVEASITTLVATIAADRRDTTDQRKLVTDALSEVQSEVALLRIDMNAVKPLAEKWERWQYIGFGAVLTIGAIGSVIGAALTYFKFWLFGGEQ